MPDMENHELLRGISTALNFKPEYIAQPSGWIAHIPFAAALVSEMKPKLIVELGAHYGHSYFAFCQSVKEARLDAGTRCYAVDTWRGDAQAGWYGEEVYQSVLARNNEHYSKFSYLLRSTFDNAVSQFADESIDILHIDGLHAYEACKHDYETWLPKVKKGGVILFHDICVRHDDFGVWKLWEEIKSVFSHTLSFSYGNGLGVLINDQKLSENKFLAGLLKPDFQHYIQIFEMLGNRTLSEADAERAKTNIHAQLYIASGEEEFAEERSVRRIYTAGKTGTLRFENIKQFLHGDTLRLRFDPADRPCQVQINRATLYSVNKDSQVVRLADFETTENIANSENAIFINDTPIDLISQGEDPQLYLPSVPIVSQDDLVFEVKLVATTGGWQEIAQCIKQIADERSVTRKKLADSQEELGKSHVLEKEQAGQIAFLEQQSSTMQSAQKELTEKLKDKNDEIEASKRQSEIDKNEIENAWHKKSEEALKEAQEAKDAEVSALRQQMQDMTAKSSQRTEELNKALKEAQKTKDVEVSALRGQMQNIVAETSQRIAELDNALKEAQKARSVEVETLQRKMREMEVESSQRIRELDEKAEQHQKATLSVEKKVACLNRLLDELRGNVERMNAAVSWRMLAPFRALARCFFSRAGRPPQDHFCLDTPRVKFFGKSKNPLQIAGWFVDAKARPAVAVRIRVGKHIVTCGSVTRPDVAAHFKSQGIEISNDRVGFSGEIKTGHGVKYLVVEAKRQTGEWVVLKRVYLWMADTRKYEENRKQAELGYKFTLDSAPSKFFEKNPFTLIGWFFDKDGREARQIRIKIGKRTIICKPRLRPDVHAGFPALKPFFHCGFHQSIKTGAGPKLVVLEAEMQSGKTVELFRRLLWQKPWQDRTTVPDYKTWSRESEKINPPAMPPKNGPLISVLMPVYNTPEKWLRAVIESVRRQTYTNWELCIADDASPEPHVKTILAEYAKVDPRIRVVYREKNGHICASSNSALEICQGEFTVLLDHDDELVPHALAEVASVIVSKGKAVSLIYSDEDKIDEEGHIMQPYFKSGWNYHLFLSHNMISHLGAYRTSLIKKVGGFRQGMHGSQDYDLALRVLEQLEDSGIYHIPKILYHWRVIPGSTSLNAEEKPYAMIAGERALNEHFKRIGCNARSELIGFGYRTHFEPPKNALVSIIIPTKNNLQYAQKCLESLTQLTSYTNYKILVVDNGSTDAAFIEYLDMIAKKPDGKVRVLRYDKPFNFSAINNFAVKQAKGNYLCFMNDDIEITSPEWLSEMVSIAAQKKVGAVGAALWYPDGTLQHGGIILGLGAHGSAGHSHHRMSETHKGYFGRGALLQEFSAVTAACLVVKKSIFDEVKGFDEENLKVGLNDVDFCLRLRERGYKNVWTPYARLTHHESISRGAEDTVEKKERYSMEVAYLKKRWGGIIADDPDYNPNLTLTTADFSLAWPPRKIIR